MVWKTPRSLKLEVDQEKAQALGVSLSDINQTMSTALGGTYVNDFIDRGRVKKVYVQADAKFRMLPEDVDKLYVRSANGEMVPFSAFTTAHWVYGSPRLERYNGLPSMEIQGEAAPGTSSGDAMALMKTLHHNYQLALVMTGRVCHIRNAYRETRLPLW